MKRNNMNLCKEYEKPSHTNILFFFSITISFSAILGVCIKNTMAFIE